MKVKLWLALGIPALGAVIVSSASVAGCVSREEDEDGPPAAADAGASAASTTPPFQFHHQPFTYFKNYGGDANADGVGTNPPNGKWALNHNLQDETDFMSAVSAGKLPAVSFVKPLYDEHPNYTTETDSQNHTVTLLNAIIAGPEWPSTVVLVTYDENGGHADHVAPPETDAWGPGTRVPGILISPFAKGGIDSTVYDTTSILTLIENRWSLPAITSRDAQQADLSAHAMSFGGAGSLAKSIQHVVVIYLENHSFDSLFGNWTGAEGLQGNNAVMQVGPDGNPYKVLPQYGPYPASAESLGDASIPNGTFNFTTYFSEGSITNDLLHRFYQEQLQINGGKMDRYVLWNNESAGQSMGYWPTASLPFPQWMKAHEANVTLCDHFFHAAFGGSFLNHFWLIGAQSPVYANAPADAGILATVNADGLIDGIPDTTSVPPGQVLTSMNDGTVTPDGFVVNTAYSVNEPHPSSFDGATPKGDRRQLVPQQTWTTIGDELDSAGQTWAWYAGGWDAALAASAIVGK